MGPEQRTSSSAPGILLPFFQTWIISRIVFFSVLAFEHTFVYMCSVLYTVQVVLEQSTLRIMNSLFFSFKQLHTTLKVTNCLLSFCRHRHDAVHRRQSAWRHVGHGNWEFCLANWAACQRNGPASLQAPSLSSQERQEKCPHRLAIQRHSSQWWRKFCEGLHLWASSLPAVGRATNTVRKAKIPFVTLGNTKTIDTPRFQAEPSQRFLSINTFRVHKKERKEN